LIHAAEGQLFRDALLHGARACGLFVADLVETELVEAASRTLGSSAAQLDNHLSQIGRAVGPPWREDQKSAALAAWIVLAHRAGASSRPPGAAGTGAARAD
jgi:hypothetical protein